MGKTEYINPEKKNMSREVLPEMDKLPEINFDLLRTFEKEYQEKHSSFIRNVWNTFTLIWEFLFDFYVKAPLTAKTLIIICCILFFVSLPLIILVSLANAVLWFFPILILGPPIVIAWLLYGAYITPSLLYDPVARLDDNIEKFLCSQPDFTDFWRTGNFISRTGHRMYTHFWPPKGFLKSRTTSSPVFDPNQNVPQFSSLSSTGHLVSSPNLSLGSQPTQKPKAIVFIVHGLIEHCRRYDHVAERLIEQNFLVYSMDHRGHGRSEGRRCYFSSIAGLAIDYLDYVRHIKEHYHPDLPIFLLGHSLGGLVTMHMIILQPKLITGFALSSPLLLPPITLGNPLSPLLMRVLNRWSPRLPLIPLILNTLCGDPGIESEVYLDPYCHQGRLAPRTIHALDKGLQFLHQNVRDVEHPFLIMQGMKDKIVNPHGATFLYAKASSEEKSLKLYESLYHEIFNEKDGLECVDHAVEFFDKILSGLKNPEKNEGTENRN